ncbi:MAG: GreA/GreB family elongation factor [Kiritimatiellae bacterium]|nr:GreA/GreB family elongation factor [Kiritimatiellia bacterium]
MQIQNLLEAETIDVAAVTTLIRAQLADDAKAALQAFTMLIETLAEKKSLAGAVDCVAFYDANNAQLTGFDLNQMRDLVRRCAATDADKLLVDSIGLNTALASAIVRRLSVLLALKPGAYVNSQSWGFGQVQQIDAFAGKVIIDFNGKKGHPMSLTVAGQNLTVADEDHLMVQYMKDPEKIRNMAPGDLVRLAIQSYGEMSVVRLADRLAETKLVTPENWKKFWDSARRSLKADKANPVEIPTKRTDPIRLLEAEEDFGDKWLARFAKQRDIKAIYDGVLAFIEAHQNEIPDSAEDTIKKRLRFALKGADRTDFPRYAQIAILMRNYDLSTEAEQQAQAATIVECDEEDNLLLTMKGLPARDVKALASFLVAVMPESKAILLDHLTAYNSTALSAVLEAMKGDPEATAAVRSLLACQAAPVPTVVVWALRNTDDGWKLPPLNDLVTQAIHIVEQRLSGESLKMRNTLQGFFDNKKWLEDICSKLTAFERQMMFERIQASTAWEAASQRSILVRMVKEDSKLAQFRRQVKAQVEQEHLTSMRSLTALKLAYDYLVNTEIPKNTQDIATARSFGDLRENSEYQYAKDQQRMLISRQSEMARRLQMLTASDFANVSCDTVKPGTRVTVKTAAGEMTYSILGELDSDETLNIISSRTRLAMALIDNAVNATVTIPTEKGTTEATITAIEPLDAAVQAWLADVPTSHEPNA